MKDVCEKTSTNLRSNSMVFMKFPIYTGAACELWLKPFRAGIMMMMKIRDLETSNFVKLNPHYRIRLL